MDLRIERAVEAGGRVGEMVELMIWVLERPEEGDAELGRMAMEWAAGREVEQEMRLRFELVLEVLGEALFPPRVFAQVWDENRRFSCAACWGFMRRVALMWNEREWSLSASVFLAGVDAVGELWRAQFPERADWDEVGMQMARRLARGACAPGEIHELLGMEANQRGALPLRIYVACVASLAMRVA
jgi:hypothetical protein